MTKPAPQATTLHLPDPRPLFLRAADTACSVVDGVRPEQLPGPTPCAEYDVRALLGHLLGVLHKTAAMVDGDGRQLALPSVVDDVEDDRWPAAVRRAVEEIDRSWADSAVLDRMIPLPFGTLPGAAALAAYTGELTTHTWDLAVATGQSPDWDAEVVAVALEAIRSKLPADGRGPGVPFAAVVPVGPDAREIDQLVAWQGRNPAWSPAS